MNREIKIQLGVKNSSAVLTPASDKGRDNETMSIQQINEYLVKEATTVCRHFREYRGKTGYTSDIIPPLCYENTSLKDNIKNMMACFSNTLAAATFSERAYISKFMDYETLSAIVDNEKTLIFEFLNENNLAEKFKAYVWNKKAKR